MANTFFGFNTTLNDHAERLGSSPEDIEGLEAEEEYDALNDETFGGLGSETELEDWEAQHEQLAEIAESSRHSNEIDWDGQDEKLADISKCSRHSNDIEALLDHLGINEKETDLLKEKSVWTYDNTAKNGEKPAENSKENALDNSVKILSQNESLQLNSVQQSKIAFSGAVPGRAGLLPPHPSAPPLPKLRTVEELERMLINQAKPPTTNQRTNIPLQQQHQQPLQQQQHQFTHGYKELPVPRHPPGFQPMVMPSPGAPPLPLYMQHHQPHHQPHQPHPHHQQHISPHTPHPPPGLVRLMQPHAPPHLIPPPGAPPYPPYLYPHHPGPGYFNFPPPPRVPMQQNVPTANRGPFYNNINKQRGEGSRGREMIINEPRDEYAGLMNNREKQWLLNIQLLQVNTGTPYFDDYYYTVFKERQTKNKENLPESRNNQRYPNNRYQQHGRDHHQHHHPNHRNMGQDNRQDVTQNPLNKKIYTPLQFENSLGKLQFGSVTAPRKIIDMDIITLEKDSESTNSSRDSRKTKQLLLELEVLYALILKTEDLKNPLAVSNTKKLKELKEKQRLREMEAAPTPEQKQEVLKLLRQESIAPVESQAELLGKIVHVLLQDDKIISFVGIRKGKMLLLRIIPQLPPDTYANQVLDIWIKMLLSIPLVGRRDTIGDNILPKFYPEFKRFVQELGLPQLLEISSNLIEIIKLENNRSTPLSYQSKPPLYFILSNKFGISAISAILTRVDFLLDETTDKQQSDWSNFINCLVETLSLVGSAVALPIEPITDEVLSRHTEKHSSLSIDKKQILQKCFIHIN